MVLILKSRKKEDNHVLNLKFLSDYCMVLRVLNRVEHDDLKIV